MKYIHAGQCIKRWLLFKGKTKASLAEGINTTRPQISRHIRSKNIKLHTAQNIANFLNISLNEFLGLTDD
tara:strand:- start:2 stop:211 length:210 start_codon:yes stop_codon:yes gene_type:complete